MSIQQLHKMVEVIQAEVAVLKAYARQNWNLSEPQTVSDIEE